MRSSGPGAGSGWTAPLGLDARPIGPVRSGWVTARDVYRAILERDPYPVRMLVSFGGNLLAAQPDTALGQRALEALEFHVHTDFFLNPSAVYADIVLPAATSWEREALRTGFDVSLEGQRRVQPADAPQGAGELQCLLQDAGLRRNGAGIW
mgnify:CR=1 FL=1